MTLDSMITLRVRSNGRALVFDPAWMTVGRVRTRGGRFVGWRELRHPRHESWDTSLNESRREAGLPTVDQHAVGGGVARWFVPLSTTTVLRARGDRLEHFLRAIADGDLVAVDVATRQLAATFAERRKESDARAAAAMSSGAVTGSTTTSNDKETP